MRASADPSGQSPMRRLAILGLLFVAAILSCGKDVTGPLGSAARYVRGISWDAVFPPSFQAAGGSSSGLVQFNRVHVVLRHTDGTVALDTTIDFPAGVDSVTLSLTVKLLNDAPASGEPMTLNLGYINAAGDTVFKGGPVSLTAAPPPPGGGSNPPVKVPVSYTGPGSNAASVVISPRSATVFAGSAFSFTAVAKDNNGIALAGTPVIWNSLDPAIATITSAAAGAGTAHSQRGTARIIAQLLTGPADTVQVYVLLPAANIVAQSGNGQFGIVGTNLALPLVVKVAATDGVGVAGTTVNFAVATGGGSVGSASAISDANGLAQTTFKLGTGAGAQTVTATAAGLTNSPVTFIDTATAATASKLVVTTQPVNGVAGIALAPIVVTAEDNNGNIATTFTGPVAVAFGTNSTGATLGGTATVNAVAGVATFSTLAVNRNGTGYTLAASSAGLTGATSNAFDIAVGAPSKLVFTVQPSAAIANVVMTPAIVVNAQDSQGNPTPSFTGAVVLGFATNSTSAALGGTLTVNAVAGAATFTGISVSTSGSGYALSASATGLTSATSATFTTTGGGGATTIAVASGGAQTGPPSVALAQPVVILVTDAGANPVAGTTVNFAVLTGGGSVAPVSGVTNGAGLVQATWTLGATIGAQSISATSAGLAGSPLTITATAAVGAPTQVVFTQQPTNAIAGVAIAPAMTVTAKDALNNTVTTFTGNVTLAFGANPGGTALNGTTTIAAVAGVATFNSVFINKVAAGYTLVASSGALSPATSGTFNITAAATSMLAISAGQGQSGNTSTALATPLAVLVTDAFANPVSGVTMNWATPSGGSLAPVSSVTNAAGVATSTWTLGAGIGAQTATATSGALAGSPLTFTATATLTAANKTWTGATDNLWATATNWLPAGVPAATDSVLIPVTANNPTLAATAMVADLYISSGATLTLGGGVTLADNGTLDATGGILGTGNVVLNGAVPRNIKGSVTAGSVSLFGTYTQNFSFIVLGNLVMNTNGSLVMNGYTTAVTGNFSTAGTGTLTMNNAADALTVTGNVTFGGGNETGLLTAGNLFVTGSFAQASGSTSFIAAAAHTTTLNGTAAQTVNFQNPFPSTFGAVVFANTAGVTLQTNMISNGAVTVSAGAVSGTAIGFTIGGTLTDPGALLAVASISFTGSTTPVAATTPTINANVTFNNNPSILAGNLTVNGAVNVDGNLQLNSHYLVVNGAFGTLVAGQLTMTNAADSLYVGGNATFGGGGEAGILTAGKMVLAGNFTQSNNGNGQEFKAVAGHLTVLTGSAAQGISFANPDTTLDASCANSCFGDLTINKSGGIVVYGTAADHRGTLTVMPGVTSVTATTSIVTVHGSTVTPASTAVHFASLGTFGSLALDPVTLVDTIAFDGSAAQVIPAGTYNRTYIKGTPTVAAGGFSTTADLTVDGGNFALGGKGVVAGGNFVTQNGGKLTMTNANDSLFVSDSAIFNGGPEAGLLTAGQLYVYKAMSVAGAGQFSASGTHQTFLVGPQIICDCDRLIRLPGGFSAAGTTSRADAIRAAAAPRRPTLARAPRAGALRLAGDVPRRNQLPPLTALALPNQPVTLAFGSTTGNSFGRLFIHGGVDWQTPAVVSDSAILDTNAFVSGVGRMIVAGSLVGSSSSRLLNLYAVELSGTGLGTFSDSGRFEADTTIWNGSNQLMPATVGPFTVGWRNIVVNSPTLRAYSDSTIIYVNGSVVIQNSGQLRLGNAGWTTSMSVGDVFQTQGSGTLRMNDDPATVLSLSNGASFAGGSTAGLLTSGSLNVRGDFTQSGSATSFSASGSHTTTLQGFIATVSFTNPGTGATASHFANLVNANDGSATFGSGLALATDVYADGVLSASSVLTDSVSFIGTGKLVAQGAAVSVGVSSAILNFHGVEFVLTDGATFSSFDGASFSAFTPTGTNFEFARSSGTYTLNNLIFNTAPSGGNLLNVSGATPALTIAHPFPAYPWTAGTQYVKSAGASVTVTP